MNLCEHTRGIRLARVQSAFQYWPILCGETLPDASLVTKDALVMTVPNIQVKLAVVQQAIIC